MKVKEESEKVGLKLCTLMADSCQCMQKPVQYCKVISLQLKEKEKKIKILLARVKRMYQWGVGGVGRKTQHSEN